MKKEIVAILMACFLLSSCNNALIGDDNSKSVTVLEEKDDIKKTYDAKKYFDENYIDEHKLPILDIHVENPFVSDDRVLVLEDSIENNIELMIYEYYHNRMSGAYQKVKDAIRGKNLIMATENEEKNFKEGIYYNKITLDEIDVVDKDEVNNITEANKQSIICQLDESGMTQFAIVEVEKTIILNKKFKSMGPQVDDGHTTRYYLVGEKDGAYKIVEVYWEGFLYD